MKTSSLLTVAVMGLSLLTGLVNAATPARAGRAEAAANRAAARGNAIDAREANQAKRIEAGIAKGQITPAEAAQLQTLETNISTMEAAFKSDGKLTKDEVQQLRQALNQASLQIWAQRHDTEGNQKPVSRLGKDIFAKDSLTAQIESGNITRTQAKEFLQDFRKLANLKRRLATETLTPDQRTALQAEFNNLLNKYFLIK